MNNFHKPLTLTQMNFETSALHLKSYLHLIAILCLSLEQLQRKTVLKFESQQKFYLRIRVRFNNMKRLTLSKLK